MAKQLKDILKAAHDTIKGVHKSTTEPLSVGKDPGVDLAPKAGDDNAFIAKHSVQKWDEPYGNPNYADKVGYSLEKEKHHGNTLARAKATNEEVSDAAKKVLGDVANKHGGKVPFTSTTYKDGKKIVTRGHNDEKGNRVVTSTANEEVVESKKAEDTKCNMSEAGTWCPMHEMANCSSARPIKELSTDTYHRAAKKAAKKAMWDPEGRSGKTFKKYSTMANKFRDKGMSQEKKEKAMKEAVAPGQFSEPSDAAKAKVKQIQQKDADSAAVSRAKMGIKSVDEKHLTPAEMKKREEVAQAIDRENPKMPMSKKMAIATSTAKKVAEDLAVPLLGGDKDDESAEMAKAELKAIANQAMNLVMQIPDTMIIEPWVQSKIAQAKVMVNSVHDYMVYGDHDKQKEAEGTMDTPMTFPNMSVDVNTGQNV